MRKKTTLVEAGAQRQRLAYQVARKARRNYRRMVKKDRAPEAGQLRGLDHHRI